MLLENAYPKWEEMVKSAKERIVSFTPYFDGTLWGSWIWMVVRGNCWKGLRK
jgi:hypothetical protein